MPDIDSPQSSIGKVFPFISKPLERKFGHRTVTHSLIGWMVATLIFAAISFLALGVIAVIPKIREWIPPDPSRALLLSASFSIGYFSHLILDMMNPKGVQLFWPEDSRDVFPGNVKYRIHAGSRAEIPVFLTLCIVLAMSLPISEYGTMNTLRWLLGTPEAAAASFKTSNAHAFIEFTGVLQTAHEEIKGTAELLDVQNKKLIIYYRNQVHTLSDELSADILSHQVHLLQSKEPIAVASYTFHNESKETLFAKLHGNVLVSGRIKLPTGLKLEIPTPDGLRTLKQESNCLTLHYATPSQLKALNFDTQFELEQAQQQEVLDQLKTESARLDRRIHQKSQSDGLTPLGQEILLTTEDRDRKASELEQLTQRKRQLTLKIRRQELLIDSQKLVFSGEVTVRPLATLPKSKRNTVYSSVSGFAKAN